MPTLTDDQLHIVLGFSALVLLILIMALRSMG